MYPDRRRESWHNELSNDELDRHERIQVGESTYERHGDGRWKKYRSTIKRLAEDNTSQDEKRVSEMLSTAREVNLIGQENLDGITVLVYQVVLHNPSGSKPIHTMKFWIGVEDGLPHKQEFEDLSQSNRMTCVITFYDFNAEITIEPPPAESVEESTPQEPAGPKAATPLPNGRSEGGAGDRNADGSARAVDTKPRLLNNPRPIYTDEARNNKVEGTIRLRVLVSADGSVRSVRVQTHLPYGLDQQAIAAAYKLRFKPAMKDGQPVAYWIPVEIEFNLGR